MCVFSVLLTQDALTLDDKTDVMATTTTATSTTTVVAASTAVTSGHPVATCDVTCCHGNSASRQSLLVNDNAVYSDAVSVTCPVITLSADSESADVGESLQPAELPLQCDWLPMLLCDCLPMIRTSSSPASQNSDLLTLSSLDASSCCMKLDGSFKSQGLDDIDLTDGRVTDDDDVHTRDLIGGIQLREQNYSEINLCYFERRILA